MAGVSDYGSLAAQVAASDAAIRAEEASLTALSAGVRQTKTIASAVSDEVLAQNTLLDDLEAGLIRAQDGTGRATERAARIERNPYSLRTFCMLLWPIVLLMLLVAFWLKHLLFA